MKSIYKKILSIGLLSAFLELALVRRAHADIISAIGGTVIVKIMQVILAVVTWIAQKIFMLGGMLIELAMGLNNAILDPASNIFLFKGWTVLVNVADLALVIALIIIAFATMLDSQTYGMKKALPRLIVIALLVNFSLVIPGVFLDISGMVTEFFLEQSGLKGTAISSALAGAFDISGFLSTQNAGSGLASIEKFTASTFSLIGSMVFAIIFTIIGSIILLTMAVMLFVRFFILSFMLVLTPVIFVAWIFPGTKKHWDKWWNDFIRWTMFPPVMIFFVWLSLTSLNAFRSAAPTGQEAGTAAYAFGDGLLFNLSSVIQMVMAVMFMAMSLIAANGISISGAKGGKDMIGTMTTWGQDRIRGFRTGTQREAERAGRRAVARPVAAIGRGAAAMRKYEGEKGGLRGRVAGAAGRALGGATAAQQVALKKTYDDKFKGMSDDDLALRYSTMAADEKVFAAQQLMAKGKLSKVNEQFLDRDIVDPSTEAVFTKYGGEKAHGNFVKAAGRNKEMLDEHGKIDHTEIDSEIKKTEEVVKTAQGFGKQVAEDHLQQLKKEKIAAESGYRDAAKKFYAGYSKKDYEALGSDFYKDGKYGHEALTSLLLNEPGAIGAATKGIGKGADMRKFMEKVEQIGNEVKMGVIEGIRQSKGDMIGSETNKELISIMKELKASNDDIAKAKDMGAMLKWIEENDMKTFKKIGGDKLSTNIEAQMKLLHTSHNTEFTALPEYEDYQHMIRMQEAMRKSAGRRLYGESEKKEEKKSEEKKV